MQSVEPNARGELPAAQRSLYLMLNFSKNHFSLDLAAETLVNTSRIPSGVTIAAGEIKIKTCAVGWDSSPERARTQTDVLYT